MLIVLPVIKAASSEAKNAAAPAISSRPSYRQPDHQQRRGKQCNKPEHKKPPLSASTGKGWPRLMSAL